MYKGSIHRLNVCTLLRESAATAKAKMEQAEAVAKTKDKLKSDYESLTSNLKTLMETREFVANNIKVVEDYASVRKERSLASIHASINSACTIVPSAKGISLKIKGQDAMLINVKGHDVNNIEGSAFRAILSYMIRTAVLRNTNYLPLMFYDEPLATLSNNTSSSLSKYLPVTSFGTTTVLTEQKKDIFAQIDDLETYVFELDDTDVSHVKKMEAA